MPKLMVAAERARSGRRDAVGARASRSARRCDVEYLGELSERAWDELVVRPGAALPSSKEARLRQDLQVVGYRRLAEPDGLDEVTHAGPISLGCSDDRYESESGRVSECLELLRETDCALRIDGFVG